MAVRLQKPIWYYLTMTDVEINLGKGDSPNCGLRLIVVYWGLLGFIGVYWVVPGNGDLSVPELRTAS